MTDQHLIRVFEQIGELNGTVKEMSSNMREFIEANQKMHSAHSECCSQNKVEIGKINSRHATYWKIIGSLGGLAAFFKIGTKI